LIIIINLNWKLTVKSDCNGIVQRIAPFAFLQQNGKGSLVALPDPEALLQEAVGDHRPVRRSGVQIRFARRPGVPAGVPRHHEGPALDPLLRPRDCLRHQVPHPRPAPQPPSHSPDCAQEARRGEDDEGEDLRCLRLPQSLSYCQGRGGHERSWRRVPVIGESSAFV
jgi:hypothetical protein